MATSLLALAQQAMPEMNLAAPQSLFASGIQDNLTIVALFNAAGAELAREFDWNELIVEYRFNLSFLIQTGTVTNNSAVITGLANTAGPPQLDTTFTVTGTGIPNDTYIKSVDSATQVTLTQPLTGVVTGSTKTINFSKTKYAFPSDYDRQVNRSQWDKTKHWEMLGPESQQQWQWLKSGYISTGPRMRWTMQGSNFQVWPPTPSTEYLGLVYITKNWVATAAGAGGSLFTSDTDTCVFPDRLMVLGVKKKYFEVKGFDASYVTHDYQMHLGIAKAANLGASNLSFAPTPSQVLISIAQVPDTGYGS
jgi:hypothetical protein